MNIDSYRTRYNFVRKYGTAGNKGTKYGYPQVPVKICVEIHMNIDICVEFIWLNYFDHLSYVDHLSYFDPSP